MSTTPAQLSAAITSSGLPTPSADFLRTLLPPNRTVPTLPALLKTAKIRLLAADFTSSSPPILAPHTLSFPANTTNPNIQEQKLAGPIPVQVLGVEDLSKSRWEQLEAIEAHERGETTKGREIIRVVAVDENEQLGPGAEGGGPAVNVGGPHRLVLQDLKGQRVYGLELRSVEGIGIEMNIGTKLVLKGVAVARGVVLMEPATVTVLGGKIESLHKVWVENKKSRLETAIGGGR